MNASWKTTLAGLLTIFVSLLTSILSWLKTGAIADPSSLVVSLSAGLGLIAARDNNVTSEQAGAKPNNLARNLSVVLLFGCLAGLMFGCASKLQPGGAYAPLTLATNSTGVVTTNATYQPEIVLYDADISYKIAFDMVDGALAFEFENRAQVAAVAPQIKPALDKIRPIVWDIDQRWAMARQLYKANPVPSNLAKLQSLLAEIQRLVPIVTQQMSAYVVPTPK